MKVSNISCCLLIFLLASCLSLIEAHTSEVRTCTSHRSRCFLRRITCPKQCPNSNPKDPKAKVCYIDCNSPICKAECRNRIPNCHGRGAACLDPRFIGGDNVVFYFHGKKNEHFSLVSDPNLQINARFIGLRPAGRTRDYTWIQALGLLFDSHNFSLEATPASKWDGQVDHLRFSYDGKEIDLPQGYPSNWTSYNQELKVERTSSKNSVIVTLDQVAEFSVNVVPITKEDDRIHNYQVPSDDCFAHLEVEFRFFGLSSGVEGVLGRTYQPDFVNPAKPGVAMPVVGGGDKYKTSSLLSSDCKSCVFSPAGDLKEDELVVMDYGMLDCINRAYSGNGIVLKRGDCHTR
ncbi:hypothetical protein V2J09_023770 [Rumex salicifolius]